MIQLAKYSFVFSVAMLLLAACGSGQRGATDIREWLGTQVVFNDSLPARADGRDTVLTTPDTTVAAKMVVYYSAEGCTPCKLKELLHWKPLIEEYATDSLVRFVFVLNPTNTNAQEIEMTLYGMRFAHPVFYDQEGSLEQANPRLPSDPVFHTFLLDRDNRVVLVGSPVGNPKMWELYTRTIGQLVRNGGKMPSALVE